MRRAAGLLLAALVLVPASAGAGTARPPLALTATPAHVSIAHGTKADPSAVVQTAWDKLAEIAIPLARIGAKPGGRVRWLVLLREGEHVVECAPEGRPLEVEIPGPDFEARHWSA